jgi:hypothetical protein
MQLLVRGAYGAQLELLDSVAREAGMGVAVDQPRDGAETATVEFFKLAVRFPECRAKVAHRAERGDSPALAEDVCVVHDLDNSERGASKRRVRARRRCQLGDVTDEQAPPAA